MHPRVVLMHLLRSVRSDLGLREGPRRRPVGLNAPFGFRCFLTSRRLKHLRDLGFVVLMTFWRSVLSDERRREA